MPNANTSSVVVIWPDENEQEWYFGYNGPTCEMIFGPWSSRAFAVSMLNLHEVELASKPWLARGEGLSMLDWLTEDQELSDPAAFARRLALKLPKLPY